MNRAHKKKTENPKAGHPRLPPGQSATLKFPVVGEKRPSPDALDLDSWRLRVGGLVEAPFEWTWREFLALPQAEVSVDIHCVTGWSHFDTRFEGVPLSYVLQRVRPLARAQFVRFEAYSDRRHDTTLPVDLARDGTWLVHSRNGERLEVEHGFPLRTLTPGRYFYKSLKWLHKIEFLAEDQLGFWERDSNYHNNGDPWPGDQRFTTGSLKPAQVERFKAASSLVPWRGKVLLGVDLTGWEPKTQDLRGLKLKNCKLRGARLRGVDLRDSNLSLSDLREVDLREADLRGADLEGVNFSGADLRRADMRQSLLTATRFFSNTPDGRSSLAHVQGVNWQGSSGLLEDQEAFLRDSVD